MRCVCVFVGSGYTNAVDRSVVNKIYIVSELGDGSRLKEDILRNLGVEKRAS